MMRWAWSVPLPPQQKLVLLYLVHVARADNVAPATPREIAARTGLTYSDVLKVLPLLVHRGLIRRTQAETDLGIVPLGVFELRPATPGLEQDA